MSAGPLRDLTGRVVVVTGAAGGIGRGLAEAFADAGARLVLADRDEEGLAQTSAGLPGTAQAQVVATDVTDAEAVERLAEAAFALTGEVHVLCNNAGVACPGPVWEIAPSDWDWMIGVNVMGIVHGLRAFVPRMLGQASPAHVVNTASMMSLVTAPGLGAYAATKHAALAISECLRFDLQAAGAPIGVSVLCPGPVATRVHEQRYRPGHEAPAPDGAATEMHATLLPSMVPPRPVADCVVDAVRDGRFFVFPQPEYLAGIDARQQELRQAREAATP